MAPTKEKVAHLKKGLADVTSYAKLHNYGQGVLATKLDEIVQLMTDVKAEGIQRRDTTWLLGISQDQFDNYEKLYKYKSTLQVSKMLLEDGSVL